MKEEEKDTLQHEENALPIQNEEQQNLAADTVEIKTDEHEEVDEKATKKLEMPAEVAVAETVEMETPQAEAVDENATETEEIPSEEVAHPDLSAETVEIETDEHEEVDEYEAETKELPDYAQMPMAQLLAEAENLIATREAKDIKDEMEAIYGAAMAFFDEERSEKLQAFLAEGGAEMDFVFEQPLKRAIVDAYKVFKHKRLQFYKKLEEELTENLAAKKAIIEALKELPNTPGNVPDKYKQFRDYQERWRNTGPVPRTESAELWNNYHHHVDNFYDFLHISNELRDLDFKKNLEAKTALCEEAEAISALESNAETFKALQNLHKKWKIVGPVDRAHRDAIWERFSAASKIIHDKRHEFYLSLRASREELLEKKKEIIAKLQNIDFAGLKTHSAWQNSIKEVNTLRDEFKNVGKITHAENEKLWEEFRSVIREFNKGKNEFYKNLKSQHIENLERKRALLASAQALKDSEDWREAAVQLKRIQDDWKKIGYVPKTESDKIWKEFREACNYFFNRLTKHNKQLDKDLEENLNVKKAILEKLKTWTAPEGGKSNGMNELKAFINEWKEAGRVPKAEKDIDTTFNKLLDDQFAALKLNSKEASLMRFENKVHGMIEGENNRQLDREEEQLQRKLDEAQKELAQLENNILFFARSNQNSPIVKDAKRQIETQREQIELMKSKIKMLRKMAKDN